MRLMVMVSSNAHFETVRAAIKRLSTADEGAAHEHSLARLAEHAGWSEAHFQKVFTRWAGISPKRFLQYLARNRALQVLQTADNVLDATLQAKLSSPGRLHDLLVHCDAVTPGQ